MDNHILTPELKKAANHWSGRRAHGKRRWWSSPTVLSHINRLVCGVALSGPWSGLNRRVSEVMPDGGFSRGISVGCGDGSKEINLLRLNIAQHFDLFDISDARIKRGKELAIKHGVEDRVSFYVENGLNAAKRAYYDLVYWNNALHHMLDVHQAVSRSWDWMRPQGMFVMDDFVGPSRFQWTDYNLEMATHVRSVLPTRYLAHPEHHDRLLPVRVARPSAKRLQEADPTEAADSERILPAVREAFPEAEVILTGGCIYHLALNDVIANFDEEADLPLLQSLLLIDEVMARSGETHYAVAIGCKN